MSLISKLLLLVASLSLAACSSMSSNSHMASNESGNKLSGTEQIASGGNVGGSASNSMDEIDKSKLSHALDNPLGKSTHWTNANTGTSYTVTPTTKLTLAGNPYCRKYTIIAEQNTNSREMQGTACVGTDGNWTAVNG